MESGTILHTKWGKGVTFVRCYKDLYVSGKVEQKAQQ